MSVNDNIKKMRKEKGYTQVQLADLLFCNRQKIADWERGKTSPSVDDLVNLSKVFEVSTDYILGLTDAKTDDYDKQFVCDYTGLSENFISDFLYEGLDIRNYLLHFLNSIGNSEDLSNAFDSMLWYLNDYITAVEKLKAIYSETKNKTFEEFVTDTNTQLAISKANDEKDISKFRLEDLFKRIIQIYSGENDIIDFSFLKQRG
ncbi:MAG: helix-turn-helix transcriptional regulator [Ruminococcus sp.]|nr:helix-turn-helix transcriptional regulator [Ruminococcus sp.]